MVSQPVSSTLFIIGTSELDEQLSNLSAVARRVVGPVTCEKSNGIFGS